MTVTSFFIRVFVLLSAVLAFQNTSLSQVFEMWQVQPLTEADLGTEAGQYFDPQFAPSNKLWISYEADRHGSRTIFLLDLEHKLRYELTVAKSDAGQQGDFENSTHPVEERVYNAQLAWCPVLHEGVQWFAFVGSTGTNEDIYLGNLEELPKVYRLTNSLLIDDYPVWSPDGRELMFMSRRSGKCDIYRFADVPRLAKSMKALAKPGGRPVVGEVIDKGKWLSRITEDPSEEIYPVWSRDGSSIVYTILSDEMKGSELVAKNLSGGSIVHLLYSKNYILRNPSFSPDGRFLALYRAGTKLDETVNLLVYQVITTDQGIASLKEKWSADNVRKFKDVKSRLHGGPYWASDGSLFFLNEKRNQRNALYRIEDHSFKNLRRPQIETYLLFGESPAYYTIRDFDFPAEQISEEDILFSSQRGNSFDINSNVEASSNSNSMLIVAGVMAGILITAGVVSSGH